MDKLNQVPTVELTFRGVLLAIFLTVILAISNTYLALRLGILSSASIPAAIVSMGILRFFKHSSIQENNAVQTAASAGEAVAGGIVYSIPALIIIHYWTHFDYWTNAFIALSGGILGVLFSIPLRRILVNEPILRFPEGQAIAEVLKSSAQGATRVRHIFTGGAVGACLTTLQNGFQLLAGSVSYWWNCGGVLFGFGAGFSPTMIGAGFLVGPGMAISILLGACIAWLAGVPIVSQFYPEVFQQPSAQEAVNALWNGEMRYLGIGAMLFAGIWTLLRLIKPLAKSMYISIRGKHRDVLSRLDHTDRDVPFRYIILGIITIAFGLFQFFYYVLPSQMIGLQGYAIHLLAVCAVLYVLVVGFIFSIITAYFSGMVGVTASPGSSIVIAGMLFAAWLLITLMNHILPLPFSNEQLLAVEAITIIVGSIVQGIAAIANDNSQDLKVGYLVGATPWKQQLMLLMGVIVASLVIPPVMQLLFDVYGIAGVMPHPGIDMAQSLPAPASAMMAAITQAVFHHQMPWVLILVGALVIVGVIIITSYLPKKLVHQISILGIAIGMYLPLESTVPLFIGGAMSWIINRRVKQTLGKKAEIAGRAVYSIQNATLIACGLLAGASLMDVILAIPFSIWHSSNVLAVTPTGWQPIGVLLALISLVGIYHWMQRQVLK